MTSATSSTSPMPGGGEQMRKPKFKITVQAAAFKTVIVSANDEREAIEKASDHFDRKGVEPIGSMRFERLPDQSN